MEDDNQKRHILLSRKLSDIPCYRQTFLYSTGASVAGGMGYFLFTSKMRKACQFGLGVYATFAVTYWCYCRYNYSLQQFQLKQIHEALRRLELRKPDE